MRVGIVGSEAAKFTLETEQLARSAIKQLLGPRDIVVSGACHLGGIDIWAIEEAKLLGLEYKEYKPRELSWPYYKARNEQIARNSDIVCCITIKNYPESYAGLRFSYCYHCKRDDHIKSGGCWTVKHAKAIGKAGRIIII